MKVALLLFGQPRFADRPEVLNAYKKFFLDHHDTDVYCHMWYDPEATYSASTWSGMTEVKVPENAPEVVRSIYNPVKLVVDKPQTFGLSAEAHHFLYSKFPQTNPQNLSNIFSQLFSVQAVTRLIDEPEKYDWIVLCRYDAVIRDVPDLGTMDPQRFYLQNNNPPFPDIIQVFNPSFLPGVRNVFDDLPHTLGKIWEPTPEQFKFWSFSRSFSRDQIQPSSMYGDVIRR